MDATRSPWSAVDDADARLVRALARDLDGSFPILVQDHQDRLYSIALRMLGDPSDAEEAAQDALVRAYRALAGYAPDRIAELRLRGWLATVVLNLCRSRRTRRAAHPTRSLDDVDTPSGREPIEAEDRGPEAVILRRSERDAWSVRLLRLTPAYRAAVILRHIDGLSYPEIAVVLGRPEGTVKAQVHRGINQLRTMLEDEGRPGPQEMTA
jgi:RNA polymerase sigma-70 factor, ECF subfamily